MTELADRTDAHYHSSILNRKDFGRSERMDQNPLEGVAAVFRAADIGFVNLEMPLASAVRRVGDFQGDPQFSVTLAKAGVTVVSLANNHALDAEGAGLDKTIAALRGSGINPIGAGVDLEQARLPSIIECNGISIAILAYTQIPCEQSGASFATSYRSGMAPLDPVLIAADVRKWRRAVDFIVLSFHWGIEGSSQVHPRAREIARSAVEAGASLILGHHPHLPQGIERIGDAFIVYSMGNLLFGHSHDYWSDNILMDVIFNRNGICHLQVWPIAGAGRELFRPRVLEGERAVRLLRHIANLSRPLGVRFRMHKGCGVAV
ncbi:CapA family protein [Acidovorax sp. Root217]|uniref:CapA family protein n=1 Tax=Acidovorax sp. Root217 TaxID=1736492 RepID=UPI00138F4E5E|nr:CapA family protein [Acidovorax sp. Root217]